MSSKQQLNISVRSVQKKLRWLALHGARGCEQALNLRNVGGTSKAAKNVEGLRLQGVAALFLKLQMAWLALSTFLLCIQCVGFGHLWW